MAKTTTPKLPEIEPTLYVKLSDPAALALQRIRSARGWNKKTAVEFALNFFDMNADKLNFKAGGAK